MDDPFYSSKYHIRRAKKHADSFKALLQGFAELRPYRRVVEYDAETGEDVYKVKLTQPVPEDLSGIAFDTANNLRSALDNAVFTLTKSQVGEYVGFPIRKDSVSFENGLKRYCTKNGRDVVPPELQNLIRTFKPYKGGNHLLWAMDVLCNTNKHAVVCPAMTRLTWANLNMVSSSEGVIKLYMPFWDHAKEEMIYDRSPHGTENKTQFHVAPFIAIGDIPFLSSKPAIAVLYEFIREVEGIVVALEAECARIKWL